MSKDEYKNCPYCDEEIKIQAIKCKHCRSSLDNPKINDIAEERNYKPGITLVNNNCASDNVDCIDGQNEEHTANNKLGKNENSSKVRSVAATISIILGSIGLVFSWAPIGTLVLSGIGLLLGIISLKSNKWKLATVAIVICSVGLLINITLHVVTYILFVVLDV